MYIGLQVPAYRLTLRRNILFRASRPDIRTLCSTSPRPNWHNETPPGGLTEVLVYRPESQILWPDTTLGIFAQADPRFVLPGNVGVPVDANAAADATSDSKSNSADIPRLKIDVLEAKTSREHQAQTLYSAHDYIQYTSGSESYVCSNPVLLETFPSAFADMQCRFELHEAPRLLKKEAAHLFPGVAAFTGENAISVITVARQTKNDMSTWSDVVEEEREELCDQFVSVAKEVCCRLKYDGYWADFIDPTAGIPYYTQQTNGTMFETDEKYRLLGFRIEDLGCCKVISHKDFGRNVFVGSIFTSVPIHTGIVQDLFQRDLKLASSLATFHSDKKVGNVANDADLFS